MSATASCHAELMIDIPADGKLPQATVGEVQRWLAQLPRQATLSPISRDYGHQRDPYPVMIGLRAEWKQVFGTGALRELGADSGMRFAGGVVSHVNTDSSAAARDE